MSVTSRRSATRSCGAASGDFDDEHGPLDPSTRCQLFKLTEDQFDQVRPPLAEARPYAFTAPLTYFKHREGEGKEPSIKPRFTFEEDRAYVFEIQQFLNEKDGTLLDEIVTENVDFTLTDFTEEELKVARFEQGEHLPKFGECKAACDERTDCDAFSFDIKLNFWQYAVSPSERKLKLICKLWDLEYDSKISETVRYNWNQYDFPPKQAPEGPAAPGTPNNPAANPNAYGKHWSAIYYKASCAERQCGEHRLGAGFLYLNGVRDVGKTMSLFCRDRFDRILVPELEALLRTSLALQDEAFFRSDDAQHVENMFGDGESCPFRHGIEDEMGPDGNDNDDGTKKSDAFALKRVVFPVFALLL